MQLSRGQAFLEYVQQRVTRRSERTWVTLGIQLNVDRQHLLPGSRSGVGNVRAAWLTNASDGEAALEAGRDTWYLADWFCRCSLHIVFA